MKLGEAHRHARHACVCGKPLDASAGLLDDSDQDAAPVPGDIALCAYCERILVFDDEMITRPISSAELSELESEERARILGAMRLLRETNRRLGRR